MESPSESSCADYLNIGVVDGVGVGILWLALVRWILLAVSPIFYHSFTSGSSVRQTRRRHHLLGLEIDWVGLFDSMLEIIPAASFLYAFVQSIHCGNPLITSLVFFIYCNENEFRKIGGGRWPHSIVDYSTIQSSSLFILITCGIAISEGGALRQIGIAGVVLVSVFVCCIHPSDENGNRVSTHPIFAVGFAFMYPLILACLATIVVRDRNLWTPKPQTTPEFVLLYSRIAYSTGAIDLAKLLCRTVYGCVCSTSAVEKKGPEERPLGSPEEVDEHMEMQVV